MSKNYPLPYPNRDELLRWVRVVYKEMGGANPECLEELVDATLSMLREERPQILAKILASETSNNSQERENIVDNLDV